jgi:CrcB protein
MGLFDPRQLGAVFLGGFVGTLARAGLAEAVVHDPGSWPWATLVANVAAAALLGYLTTHPVGRSERFAALGPGLCGGLSTFSTLQLELLWMLDAGHGALALAYALVSVALGLAAVMAGTALAHRRTEAVA